MNFIPQGISKDYDKLISMAKPRERKASYEIQVK